MSTFLDPRTFAELVGEEPNGVLLFRVSRELMRHNQDWSLPVQFRFTNIGTGRVVEMEVRTIHEPWLYEQAAPKQDGEDSKAAKGAGF